MKKSIICFILSLSAYFTFGQCGPYTLTSTKASCEFMLSLSGASNAQQIAWDLNGRKDTVYAGPVGSNSGITVAGGNKFGSAANQLWYPWGICLDHTGNIYVADVKNHRIQKFQAGSTFATDGITVAGGNGEGNAPNQLNNPVCVYVDDSGNIYVSDDLNYRIQKFPPGSTSGTNGITVAGGNGQGSNTNHLSYSTGVFVDRSGSIYVADNGNNRIQKFPFNGTSYGSGIIVAGGNGEGNAANQFNFPGAVYVDSSGNIYVADAYNNRIQKFPASSTSATNGITVAGGNGLGHTAFQLNWPVGVYVDPSGNIYVADTHNNRIQKFLAGSTSATNGITMAGGINSGTSASTFNGPISIALDDSGYIYVADNDNGRIQKWKQPIIGIDTSINGSTAGNYSAVVLNSNGCVATSDTISTSIRPILSSFSPISAGYGDTVLIFGHNLSNTMAVKFGGTSVSSFSILSDSTITAVISAGSSGLVSVYTECGEVSLTGFIDTARGPDVIKIYPNPANYDVIIDLSMTTAGTGEITVSDLSGKLIFSVNGTGQNSNRVPLCNLEQGFYVVHVKFADQVKNVKLSVIH